MDTVSVYKAVADFSSLEAAARRSTSLLRELKAAGEGAGSIGRSSDGGSAVVGQERAARALAGAHRAAADTSRELAGDLRKVGDAANGAQGGVTQFKEVLAQLTSGLHLNKLAGAAAIATIAAVGKQFVQQGIAANAAREQNTQAFKSLLKDGQAARDLVLQIEDAAAFTPFKTDELTQAIRQLLVMGVPLKEIVSGTGKDVKGLIIDIGNAAAAQGPRAGEALGRISEVIGRINSIGRVTGEDVRSLAAAGINVNKVLAEQLGLTADQIQNIATSGVSATQVINAIQKDFQTSFAGSMLEQATTFNGLMSTIGDTLEQLKAVAFKGLFEAGKKSLTQLTDALGVFLADVRKVGFAAALKESLPQAASLLDGFSAVIDAVGSAFKTLAPAAKGAFEALAGPGVVGLTAVLRGAATAVEALVKVLNLMPEPLREAFGATLLLSVAFSKFAGPALVGVDKIISGMTRLTAYLNGPVVKALDAVTTAQKAVESSAAGLSAAEGIRDTLQARSVAAIERLRAAGAAADVVGQARVAHSVGFVQAETAVATSVKEHADALQTLKAATTAQQGVQGGLLGLVKAINPYYAAAVIAVSALGAAYFYAQKRAKDFAASQYDSASATALAAKSLGITTNAIGERTNAEGKAVSSTTKFYAENEKSILQLRKMSEEVRRATILDSALTLRLEGVTPEDVQKYLDTLQAALGDFALTVPIKLEEVESSQAQLKGFVDKAQGQLDELSKAFKLVKLDLPVVSIATVNPVAGAGALAANKILDAFGLSNADQTKKRIEETVSDLSDTVSRAFASNNPTFGFVALAKLEKVLKDSTLDIGKQGQILRVALEQVSDLSNIDFNAKKFEEQGGSINTFLKLVASGVFSAGPEVQKFARDLYTLDQNGKPLIDTFKDVDAALRTTGDAAAEAAQNLEAFNAVQKAGEEQTKAYEAQVKALASALQSFGDLSKAYSEQLKSAQDIETSRAQKLADSANKAASSALDAKKKALDEQQKAEEKSDSLVIRRIKIRQAIETQALESQGKLTNAVKDQLRQRQEAELHGAAVGLVARDKARKATKAALDNTEIEKKSAKDYERTVTLSLTSVAEQFRKKNEELIKFRANYEQLDRKTGRSGVAAALAKFDPTGQLLARANRGDKGAQKLIAEVQRNAKLVGDAEVAEFSKQQRILEALQKDAAAGTNKTSAETAADLTKSGLSVSAAEVAKVALKSGIASLVKFGKEESKKQLDAIEKAANEKKPNFEAIGTALQAALAAGLLSPNGALEKGVAEQLKRILDLYKKAGIELPAALKTEFISATGGIPTTGPQPGEGTTVAARAKVADTRDKALASFGVTLSPPDKDTRDARKTPGAFDFFSNAAPPKAAPQDKETRDRKPPSPPPGSPPPSAPAPLPTSAASRGPGKNVFDAVASIAKSAAANIKIPSAAEEASRTRALASFGVAPAPEGTPPFLARARAGSTPMAGALLTARGLSAPAPALPAPAAPRAGASAPAPAARPSAESQSTTINNNYDLRGSTIKAENPVELANRLAYLARVKALGQ